MPGMGPRLRIQIILGVGLIVAATVGAVIVLTSHAP
jgi:hypothetical protein